MSQTFNSIKARRAFLRYLTLFGGLYVVANGIVLTINANVGVNPWDVFHIGIANLTPLTIGRVIQIVGLVLVVVSYFKNVRPNIGTVLNMIFLGFFVDLIIAWGYIPLPPGLGQRAALFVAGVFLYGSGGAIYISANLGAGPRDSLMLALTKASRFRVGTIRTFMEVTVALLGYLLGGPLGLGTVIFALTVGIFMEFGFAVIEKAKKTALFGQVWQKPCSSKAQ